MATSEFPVFPESTFLGTEGIPRGEGWMDPVSPSVLLWAHTSNEGQRASVFKVTEDILLVLRETELIFKDTKFPTDLLY